MSSFMSWLTSLDQRRTVLVEVDYLEGGSSRTLYLGNRPFVSGPNDSPASTPYDDVIVGGLTYGRSLGSVSPGSLSLTVGSIRLAASPEIVSASLHEFAGGNVRVYLGDQRWNRSEFQLVAVLTAESLEPLSRSEYILEFRTERLDLDDPLNVGTITTGPNESALKPVVLGSCFNVRPLQMDEAGKVFLVSDSPVSAISEVRVDGQSVSVTKDLSAGTITFSTAPSGVVTADVVGEGGTSAKDLVTYILNRLGGVTLEAGTLDALPVYPLGLFSRSQLTYRQALNEILASVGAFWDFNRLGRFNVGILKRPQGQPTATLTPDDILLDGVSFDQRFKPVTEISLAYNPNYTVQDEAGFNEENSKATSQNPGIINDYPDANRKEFGSFLRSTNDAQQEAERLASFYASPLKTFSVQAFAVPFSFEIGQEIEITYPYFNMEAGKNAVVMEITDDPLNGLTNLKVLTDG